MASATTTVESTQTERPPAPFQTEDFRRSRPLIVGPEVPEAPFPIRLAGPVQKGFGRGGKDLGCPTGAVNGACSVFHLLKMYNVLSEFAR
jgi:hypothetical protein